MPNFMHIIALAVVAVGCSLAWRSCRGRESGQGPSTPHQEELSSRYSDWLECIESLTGAAALCVDSSMMITDAGPVAAGSPDIRRGRHLIDALPHDAKSSVIQLVSAAMRSKRAQGSLMWAGSLALVKITRAGADNMVISIGREEGR